MQQQFNRMGKAETGCVALPAIMRSGAGGPESFQKGSMPQAKQHITSGQMHRGHMPPLVKNPKQNKTQDDLLMLIGGSSVGATTLLPLQWVELKSDILGTVPSHYILCFRLTLA